MFNKAMHNVSDIRSVENSGAKNSYNMLSPDARGGTGVDQFGYNNTRSSNGLSPEGQGHYQRHGTIGDQASTNYPKHMPLLNNNAGYSSDAAGGPRRRTPIVER